MTFQRTDAGKVEAAESAEAAECPVPAEEGGGGGKVMVNEGIMDQFEISQVYGIHNSPELPSGQIATAVGPVLAAVDEVSVQVKGKGGHAAYPHEAIDPIPALLAIAQAFDTIVSRNRKPIDALVVSVTKLNAGTATNIIPPVA